MRLLADSLQPANRKEPGGTALDEGFADRNSRRQLQVHLTNARPPNRFRRNDHSLTSPYVKLGHAVELKLYYQSVGGSQ